MENSQRVQVVVSIRPDDGTDCISVVHGETLPQVQIGLESFTFDYVYGGSTGSPASALYGDCVSPLVEALFDGRNATLIAYGQTGSGKTYTMGTNYSGKGSNVGVIPKVMEDIFQRVEVMKDSREFVIRVSFIEVLMNKVYDLLVPNLRARVSLQIREIDGGTTVARVIEAEVRTKEEMATHLSRGSHSHATESTNMNDKSSHSHAIFTITMEQKKVARFVAGVTNEDIGDDNICAKLLLVDLAGSGCAKQTGADSKLLVEGTSINEDLLALGKVISDLGGKRKRKEIGHIPYRDRKLTHLLQGINRDRVEQMEARLKEDILIEAARYGNKILVTDELPDGQMVDQWDPVSHDSVKTPLEELQVEGYLVDYERVPITDEKSPKETDFDILVHKISQANLNTEIIFNCQMGRGRTTTGMVIATLIYLNRIGNSGIPRINSIGRVSDSGANVADHLPNSEEAIRRGEYAVIRSLIRVLEGGVEGKRQVDKVIDKCATMQNLREAIATYRSSILRQPDEMKREASLSFFVEYLERYYFLICFAVFIHSEGAAIRSCSFGHSSFAEWMRARPELYSIIRRLLRRDPMGALGYATLKPSLMKIAESADGRPSEMGVVAALRKGEVLGSQTVLKGDHCPGCQNTSLPERVEGAPNFREVPGFPVYGVANPTIDGILSVIQRIGSSKHGRPVFWHNMREEPVIYINGKPFVLREVERPYKNMLEYSGFDRERVERMESRLKEDILREAEHYGNAIMVIHETDDGQIFDAWEHVSADSIQTPLEVFKSLEANGFPIKYARVPITDGKAPKSSDFDTLAANIASALKDTAFVFNCQMGIGRTTTGTVIACLLKLRIDYGRPIKILVDDKTHEEVNGGTSSGDETGGSVAASTTGITKIRSEKEKGRVFGINDILLLWTITRLFDNGVECREALDAIIDRCSALQNIRQAVLQYRKVFNQQHVEPRVRRVALNRGAEYLERYFRLIAFAAYLGSETFDGFCGQGESRMTFKNWLHQRPEVQAMKWSIRLRPGRFFAVPEELRAPHESQHGDAVMDAIVNNRNGSVLGKGSILKMYFFPGQRTSSHIQIHAAPHVYKVDGFPVYSMATPTVDGAKEMLAYLGAKPKAENSVAHKVILTDLREEAVVYINGTPFALRELNKPVDTLKHVGITGPVVEHMEERLKEDILSEVRHSEATFTSNIPELMVDTNMHSRSEANLPSRASEEEARRMGDYRDILSLTRVLMYGPQSKSDVDIVIERCKGAGHLRDDILDYSKELEKFPNDDDEHRAYFMDMAIKALRRYFYLITFKSYLYCTSPAEMTFASWMDARPELGHLCNNLRIDK